MISETVVELSRWQFTLNALFHCLFVPLTLGLSLFLAGMESAYVLTGQTSYQAACRFWSRLFAVAFVLAVGSRLVMLFQFGMNGSYFAHYAGDIFALPLAIETLGALFPALLLFGPYRFGWDRLGKHSHLLITWLLALAVNLSALWTAIAEAWLQNPVGASFNDQSFRLELDDFSQVLDNPIAGYQAVHNLAAGYVVTSATLLAICAWLLLKNNADLLARQSFKFAAPLGLAAILLIAGLGNAALEHGNPVQQRKLAAIDGQTLTGQLADIEIRIRRGMKAYALLQDLRDNNNAEALRADFEQSKADLGYALLLQRWTEHPENANDQQIRLAAQSALPTSPKLLYWAYRLMAACSILLLPWLLISVRLSYGDKPTPSWLLTLCLYGMPLPWLAYLAGWFVSQAGNQPWLVAEMLPTFLSVSSLSVKELSVNLAAYTLAYGAVLWFAWHRFRHLIANHLSNPLSGSAK